VDPNVNSFRGSLPSGSTLVRIYCGVLYASAAVDFRRPD
jgi:hypothetical protein